MCLSAKNKGYSRVVACLHERGVLVVLTRLWVVERKTNGEEEGVGRVPWIANYYSNLWLSEDNNCSAVTHKTQVVLEECRLNQWQRLELLQLSRSLG